MVTDNFFLDIFVWLSPPFFSLGKTKLISSCVFKAWAGRIGVQIFIFLCFEGGIKEVFFFSSLLYIHVFCPAGLWKNVG